MKDKKKYALLMDEDTKIPMHLARRHLDAVSHLTVSTAS